MSLNEPYYCLNIAHVTRKQTTTKITFFVFLRFHVSRILLLLTNNTDEVPIDGARVRTT